MKVATFAENSALEALGRDVFEDCAGLVVCAGAGMRLDLRGRTNRVLLAALPPLATPLGSATVGAFRKL